MKSSQAQPTFRSVFLLLCLIEIVGCRVGSIGGDVRSAARKNECTQNLRKLYTGLEKYVSLHCDVPRGKDGKVSIVPLTEQDIQRAIGIDSLTLKCPADPNSTGPSYILNPTLSTDDFGSDSVTVIACDRAPNHRRGSTDKNTTVVLIGDGSVVDMDIPEEDQKAFLSGNKNACHISMKDGSRGHWTIADVIWFVGQEKGHVPNE